MLASGHAWQKTLYLVTPAEVMTGKSEVVLAMYSAYLKPLIDGRSASFAFSAHASQNSCAVMSDSKYVNYIPYQDPSILP